MYMHTHTHVNKGHENLCIPLKYDCIHDVGITVIVVVL